MPCNAFWADRELWLMRRERVKLRGREGRRSRGGCSAAPFHIAWGQGNSQTGLGSAAGGWRRLPMSGWCRVPLTGRGGVLSCQCVSTVRKHPSYWGECRSKGIARSPPLIFCRCSLQLGMRLICQTTVAKGREDPRFFSRLQSKLFLSL